MRSHVLIVGAGPGGSYLAYLLAKQGVDVLVIDKASVPRPKVCGGGISLKTMRLLDFSIEPVVQRHIRGAWLTFQNQDMVEATLGDPSGCSILREEFDKFILDKAIEAGARFVSDCSFEDGTVEGSEVRVQTSCGEVRSSYLVGADGVFSRVRRSFFPKDLVSYAPAVEMLVPVDSAVLAQFDDRTLFDFGGMPNGYGWIFPKKDHLNVGVFSMFPQRTIREDLRRFVGYYSTLRETDALEVLGHAIPTGNTQKLYAKSRVLLVGDAAGFAEAFYGEGIYFALRSAQLAAEAFDVKAAAVEREYSQLVDRHLAPDLFYSDLLARLFFPRQKFGFYRMVRNRHCNRYFAELIGGGISYRECFFKTAATLPYWLLSGRIAPSKQPPF